MLTFLFWNMGGDLPESTPAVAVQERKNRLRSILGNLVRQHSVDLLMLAEWSLSEDEILSSINDRNPIPFQRPDPRSQCKVIAAYPRFPGRFFSLFGASESARYTCRHLRLPGHPELLLFIAHLGSKQRKSEASQTLAAPVFSPVIRLAEKRAGHQRTILVGDLNMNPFDDAMVGAEGLNAVMTKELALRESRIVDKKEYPFFYNPMWGHFGDSSHEERPPGYPDHEPAGSCYYPAGESRWYYWNMFDQVLIRPALVPHFHNRDLRILVTDGRLRFSTGEDCPTRSPFPTTFLSFSAWTSEGSQP
jgi:hypothetical protein